MTEEAQPQPVPDQYRANYKLLPRYIDMYVRFVGKVIKVSLKKKKALIHILSNFPPKNNKGKKR